MVIFLYFWSFWSIYERPKGHKWPFGKNPKTQTHPRFAFGKTSGKVAFGHFWPFGLFFHPFGVKNRGPLWGIYPRVGASFWPSAKK